MPADPARAAVGAVRDWLPGFLIALSGLAVSGYLTVEHYTSSALLACPETSVVNCAKVTSSAWSTVAGVPVALGGVLYFAAMAALSGPLAAGRAGEAARLAGGVAGVLGALYFVWVELFRVEAICLWCTAAHAAAVLLLCAVLWRRASAGPAVTGTASATQRARCREG